MLPNSVASISFASFDDPTLHRAGGLLPLAQRCGQQDHDVYVRRKTHDMFDERHFTEQPKRHGTKRSHTNRKFSVLLTVCLCLGVVTNKLCTYCIVFVVFVVDWSSVVRCRHRLRCACNAAVPVYSVQINEWRVLLSGSYSWTQLQW